MRRKVKVYREPKRIQGTRPSLSPAHAPLTGPAPRGERGDSLRLLQQAHGNAYVQRAFRVASPGLQRESAPQPKRPVPGLEAELVAQIETQLSQNGQAALDTLFAALVKRGDMDPSFLAGERMTVVKDTEAMAPGHHGHTTLTEGKERPRPSKVVIGPDAFASVGDLYATVMHEWKHVLQFRQPELVSDAMAEFEAFLWEAENIEQTGLWQDMDYMQRIGNLMRASWTKFSEVEKAAMRPRYEAAQELLVAKKLEAMKALRERIKPGGKR
jgi:hypothetical protein